MGLGTPKPGAPQPPGGLEVPGAGPAACAPTCLRVSHPKPLSQRPEGAAGREAAGSCGQPWAGKQLLPQSAHGCTPREPCGPCGHVPERCVCPGRGASPSRAGLRTCPALWEPWETKGSPELHRPFQAASMGSRLFSLDLPPEGTRGEAGRCLASSFMDPSVPGMCSSPLSWAERTCLSAGLQDPG